MTDDNNYIIAGSKFISNTSFNEKLLLKIDSNGDIIFNLSFFGDTYDSLQAMKNTLDGNVIIVGGTSMPGGIWDGLVLKFGINGNLIWQNAYGRHWNGRYGGDIAFSVENSQDGGYVIALSDGFIYGEQNIPKPYLIKTDSNGNLSSSIVSRTTPNISINIVDYGITDSVVTTGDLIITTNNIYILPIDTDAEATAL